MTGAAAGRLIHRGILAMLIGAALTFSMLPIVWMATTSVKSPGEFVSREPTLIPEQFTTMHYERLWAEGFPRRLTNSLIVTFGATAISLVVGFCAAYSLTRFEFPARLDALFLLWVLLIKMVPTVEDDFLHLAATKFGCRVDTVRPHLIDLISQGHFTRTNGRPPVIKYAGDVEEETFEQEHGLPEQDPQLRLVTEYE